MKFQHDSPFVKNEMEVYREINPKIKFNKQLKKKVTVITGIKETVKTVILPMAIFTLALIISAQS
jgi:hypothetical protein